MRPIGLLTPTVLALSLLLGACASHHLTVHQEYPPRPPGHRVEVWMGTSVPGDVANAVPDAKLGRPPLGVTIIGQIEQAKTVSWGWSGVVRDAKREARQIGGDGIIIEHAPGSVFARSRLMMLVFRLPEKKPEKKSINPIRSGARAD